MKILVIVVLVALVQCRRHRDRHRHRQVSRFDEEEDVFGEQKNQALDAIAAQSSTQGHYNPELAIDDSDDVILTHNSCSVTLAEDDPWWMMTFNYVVLLFKVTITTATGSDEPLRDVSIVIDPDNVRCGAEKPRDPGQPSEKNTFTCPFETVGVILKITAHGSRRVLALCDVNAYGAVYQHNVALHGTASQSSTDQSRAAQKAIDGNADNVLTHNSCSMTKQESAAWWMLTFKDSIYTSTVVVVTSSDRWRRPTKLDVKVGPYDGRFESCTDQSKLSTQPTAQYSCPHRYSVSVLKITNPDESARLVLCEVICYSRPDSSGPTNFAYHSHVVQSSTHKHFIAERAIDGNADGKFDRGSCSATKTETNPWWQVTFENEIYVRRVTIASRADCCGDQVLDVTVGTKKTYKSCVKGGITMKTGETNSYSCGRGSRRRYRGLLGKKLKIEKRGVDIKLVLCEVFVFGRAQLGCRIPRQCLHGGRCENLGRRRHRCNCLVKFHGAHCELCMAELEVEPNKEQRDDGVVRADAQTRSKCQVACLELEENCASFDFRNGVCRIHHQDDDSYEYGQEHQGGPTLTVAYGSTHYRVVDSDSGRCPRE